MPCFSKCLKYLIFFFFNEVTLSSFSSSAHRYVRPSLAHRAERQMELSDCQPESKGQEMEEIEQCLWSTGVQKPGLSGEFPRD